MTRDRYRALPESEARVLLLIDGFSRVAKRPRALEGRVKLAKLDFLLRYPKYLARVLSLRNAPSGVVEALRVDSDPLRDRMVRYRYGPWDPAYYAILGSLIGRGLVVATPTARGIGYRTTDSGQHLVERLIEDETWAPTAERVKLVRRYLDRTGTYLMNCLYEAVPEMTEADWWDRVE